MPDGTRESCQNCNGEGWVYCDDTMCVQGYGPDQGPCDRCKGTGDLPCPICGGKGFVVVMTIDFPPGLLDSLGYEEH